MATAERVLSNAGLLLQDVAMFAHGQFATGSEPINLFNAGRELLAIAAIVAVVFLLAVVARSARAIVADDSRTVELRLLGIYWVISMAAVSLAFVMTTAPSAPARFATSPPSGPRC